MMKEHNQNFSPRELPLPDHYDPKSLTHVWRVLYQERANDANTWVVEHNIRPSAYDKKKVGLILVDVQNTFCLPEFELFVAGQSGDAAIEDNRRLCEFIYRNLDAITHITVTLDTHRAIQIFHPIYLIDDQGNHPDPLTLITYNDVRVGRWRFNPNISESLGISAEEGQQHLLHYTHQLMRSQKYDLTIWPYHAMQGGIGNALVSAVEEAVFFHAVARQSQTDFIIKGEYQNTENYSVIGPEVLEDANGEPIAKKDMHLFKKVEEFDAVVIAGQAKSHCVAWTISDLLDQINDQDPKLVTKVYLLEDCTSPVVVPDVVDYTDQADEAFLHFQQAGMNLVRSTEPISSWLGA